MTNPRSHVRPGDRLALAASQVNFLNGLMDADMSMSAGPLKGWQFGGNVVLVRNATALVVPRWGVLQPSGIEIDPGDGDIPRRQFESMPCLVGVEPSSTDDRFVIAIEPIGAGKIGRAAIAGVTAAKLTGGDANSKWAKSQPGGVNSLLAGKAGPAEILWRNGSWGLVRIGRGDSGLCDKAIGGHDITQWAGWDATKNQILGHDTSGCLKWFDVVTCDPPAE